jgi:chemotaxis protein CheC
MIELTEFQQDAISELLNIGMGRASASLSEMVGEEVLLSVPKVEILSHLKAEESIKSSIGAQVTTIRESFKGAFWGDALLIFPENQSLALVKALLKGEDLPLEILSEMEQEALTEVGNIILNACLGSLSNIFKQDLEFSLPQYAHGHSSDLIQQYKSTDKEAEGVLMLQMNFILQTTKVNGYLTLLMDVDSMQALSKELELYFGVKNI